jgi:hypothetical protein
LYVPVPWDKTGLLLPIFSWDVHSKKWISGWRVELT